jgi:hypothetical protein
VQRFNAMPRRRRRLEDVIPDVRDGLTREERIVLWQISELQKERAGRSVPTAMLYGRVLDHLDVSVDELQEILQRLIGTKVPPSR